MVASFTIWALLCSVVTMIHGAPAPETRSSSGVKIVGGTVADPGEFPFLVSVQLKSRTGGDNDHQCGGTLYNMSRVITAASCVRSGIPEYYVIVAGAYTMVEAIQGMQQTREVSNIILHPNYDPLDPIVHDDIAIVDLEVPFDSSVTVQSLPLARRYYQFYDTVCVIAGWGATTDGGTHSEKILKGDVFVHPRDNCSVAYPGEYDQDMQICANGINDKGEVVDACAGDVGGPLICTGSDGFRYLAGVSSYGWICGAIGKPGVYMEVSKYRSWLDSWLFGEGDGATTTPKSQTTRNPLLPAEGDKVAADDDQVGNKPIHQSPCGTALRK